MAKPKEISQEKIAAANYILTFFRDVALLTHSHANYENVILELESKYDIKEIQETKISDPEKVSLLTQAQEVRYYTHKTYIEYKTIVKSLKKSFPKKLEELYQKLRKQFILVRDDVLKYTMDLNFALEEQIMQDLLRSSNEFVTKAYGDAEKPEDNTQQT